MPGIWSPFCCPLLVFFSSTGLIWTVIYLFIFMSKSLLNDGWAHPGVFWWVQSSLNAGFSCNGIWTPVPRGRHRVPQKLCHQHQASQGICSCRFLSCAHTWDTLQILMLLVEWFHVYSGLSCSESRLWVVYKPSASSGLFFGCLAPSIGEMTYSGWFLQAYSKMTAYPVLSLSNYATKIALFFFIITILSSPATIFLKC